MPYISRNNSGDIFGLYNREQYPKQEFLEKSHQDVIGYREKKEASFQTQTLIRKKIVEKQRIDAVIELKQEGKLAADFVDKVS